MGLGASAATAAGLVGWRAPGPGWDWGPGGFDPLAGYGAPWAPPPDWSPTPFNYWGFSVLPVFDPFYEAWGFWPDGIWIPLTG